MSILHNWCVRTGEKPYLLARRLGRPPSTIYRIVNGERVPGIELARAIEKATSGEVRAADLMLERLFRETGK